MMLHATDAAAAILAGRAQPGLTVTGTLDLTGITQPFALPRDLRVEGDLLVSHSHIEEIGDGLKARTIHAVRCPRLTRIGRVSADYLTAKSCNVLVHLESPLKVLHVDLSGCLALASLPPVVRCARLDLQRCVSLSALPDRLTVQELNVSGCRRLRTMPTSLQASTLIVDEQTGFPYDWRRMRVSAGTARQWIIARRARSGLRVDGSLSLVKHTWLRDLPAALHVDTDLNLEGCSNLASLPANLEVGGKLTLTGCTKLGALPADLKAGSVIMPDGQARDARPKRLGWWGAVKAIATVAEVMAQVTPSTPPEVLAQAVGPEDARRAIVDGRTNVAVRGDLTVSGLPALSALPAHLAVFGNLTLSNLDGLRELPGDLRVSGALRIEGCRSLQQLPALAARSIAILRCPSLVAHGPMTAESVIIDTCGALGALGPGIDTAHLSVKGCARLQRMAEPLPCEALVLAELPALERVPTAPALTTLSLRAVAASFAIPATVSSLMLHGLADFCALPERLELQALEVVECPRVTTLPGGLKITGRLTVRRSPIRTIPADTRAVSFEAVEMPELETIEATWRDLEALRIDRCPRLVALPAALETIGEGFWVERCEALTALPPRLRVNKRMSIQGCTSLRALPSTMPPPEAIELGGTAIERLPVGWHGVALTWERLVFTERQLFETEALTPDEVLAESNVEARRVLIERYGLTRLMSAKSVELVDEDVDPGGARRLLRVPMGNREAYVVLEVRCPSTARTFHLRVAPHLATCRAAAAWTAGFHRPEDYNPIVET